MGKQDYKHSDRVRFGELPKEERKAINKVMNKQSAGANFDHTHICNSEIGQMLACFEANQWNTAPCLPQIQTMYACVEEHKNDPDPKILARRWQVSMKNQVFQHFSRARVLGRLAK